MKKDLAIVLFTLFTVFHSIAQSDEKTEKSKFPLIKPELILDGRITLVSSEEVRLGGFRAGIELNRVNRFGFGFYGITNGVNTTTLNEISPDIVSANMKLNYGSLYYERVLIYNKKYEWSTTLHIGAGSVSGKYTYRDGTTGNYDVPVQMTELSTTLFRHLTYFISVGGGIGYRQTRNAPEELLPIYNSPVLILKLRLQVIKGVRGIWNKDIRTRF